MAVDKPVQVKGATIVSPSPITSFDGGLDERGEWNIAPNCFQYARNMMVNSSGNAVHRLAKRRWLPDSTENCSSEVGTAYYNGILYFFIADDGVVKYCTENSTSWTACGGDNAITTGNEVRTTFVRSGNWVTCNNGVDPMRYINLEDFEMVQFLPVDDPVNTLTAARTGLTSGGITIYYAINYNSNGGGMTKLSNILSYTINKSRNTWKTDGTEYLTITFNDTPPTNATGRNLWISLSLKGTTPTPGDMFMLNGNIALTDTEIVDNGSQPISLTVASDINTTAGIKAKNGFLADNSPVFYGNPDEPYTVYFPSVVDGGGISFGGDAQSIKLLDGTNHYPTSVIGFRNNQNIPTLLSLFSGTDGTSKQQTISQKTLSYGNNTLTYWGADDLNSGASAVYSSYATISYLNQLLFPSSEGIVSIKTEADLQNVLSPNIISEPIDDTYKTIKSVSFDKIISAAWNNLIMFSVPSRGFNHNNQIIVYDLNNKQKPKWYIWDIETDWIGTISPPNRDSFVYIRKGKKFYKLVESKYAEEDNGNGDRVPIPLQIDSALVPFNQQKNSYIAMTQAVLYVEYTGTITVTVSYYNQKGKLKHRRKTYTEGTPGVDSLAGWSSPRLLYRSWNNRVIGWSKQIPTADEDTGSQAKVKRRLRVRIPNPVINEYKVSVTASSPRTSLSIIGFAPEGVNIGVIGDIV